MYYRVNLFACKKERGTKMILIISFYKAPSILNIFHLAFFTGQILSRRKLSIQKQMIIERIVIWELSNCKGVFSTFFLVIDAESYFVRGNSCSDYAKMPSLMKYIKFCGSIKSTLPPSHALWRRSPFAYFNRKERHKRGTIEPPPSFLN